MLKKSYKHNKSDARRRKKQNEADIRNEKYQLLSLKEKMARNSKKVLAKLAK